MRGEAATEHWIAVAKAAFVAGRVTLEQLEEDVSALLAGGPFPGHCIPSGLPTRPAPDALTRVRE